MRLSQLGLEVFISMVGAEGALAHTQGIILLDRFQNGLALFALGTYVWWYLDVGGRLVGIGGRIFHLHVYL